MIITDEPTRSEFLEFKAFGVNSESTAAGPRFVDPFSNRHAVVECDSNFDSVEFLSQTKSLWFFTVTVAR
jgi:hypothetical protein